MHRRLNRTSLCSILYMDIVGYSRQPDAEQIVQKARFNALVQVALNPLPRNELAISDSGDGAAVAFFGAPEDALTVALIIREGISRHNREYPEELLALRMGIHLGPVRVVHNINGKLDILGDGLNVAQSVMSFSAPNQILVSRSYYEIVAPENPDIVRMFSYFGVKADSDVRDYELYLLAMGEGGAHAERNAWSGMRPERVRRMVQGATAVVMLLLAVVVMRPANPPAIAATIAAPVAAEPGTLEAVPIQKQPVVRHQGAHRAAEGSRQTGTGETGCSEAQRMISHCG